MDIRTLLPVTAKNLKNNLPFYVLYGLAHNPTAIYFLRDIEVSSPFKRQSVLNNLWKYCQKISPENSENTMGMLYEGWKHFDGKDIYSAFFRKEDKKLQDMLTKYPINTMRLLRSALEGKHHQKWYSDTRDAFVELLPEYEIDTLIKVFAITSPQSHPGSNLINALDAYDCLFNIERSILNMKCFESVRNMLLELETDTFDENVQKSTRRKVIAFMKALMGDEYAVVVDSWMLNACGLGKKYFWRAKGKFYTKCRKREYDLIEYYIRSLAEASGYAPRELTAMVWAGIRKIEGRYKAADMRKVILNVTAKSHN